MMARGFKPVGWVAAVAGAALGCYMLSLNVAAERAELAKIERQIIVAKQDIRSLQTELGTRGRLEQLEQWNAEVLALSAPNSAQFLENELVLARFETKQPTIEDRAKVQMAAAPVPAPRPAPALRPADYAAAAEAAAREPKPIVHRASFTAPVRGPAVQKAALVRPLAAPRLALRAEAEAPAPAKKPAPKTEARVETAEARKPAAPKPLEIKKAAAPKQLVELKKAADKPKQLAEVKVKKPAPKKVKASASSTGMLGDSLLKELGEAAKGEQSAARAGAR